MVRTEWHALPHPCLQMVYSLGWLESRIIALVLDLEKNPQAYARPFPGSFINLHEQIEQEEKGKGKGKGNCDAFR